MMFGPFRINSPTSPTGKYSVLSCWIMAAFIPGRGTPKEPFLGLWIGLPWLMAVVSVITYPSKIFVPVLLSHASIVDS